MIGLSPLSPGHRRTFQRTSVRPSTGSYPRFSLPRDSSPGFASAARDWNRPFRTRFRSGSLPSLTSPRASNSLAHSTKGTPSRDEARSDALRAHGFRYCFTPLPGCFSPFPHGTRSLSVIGECLALEGGPPCFAPDFTCPALLGLRIARGEGVRVRGLHPVSPACPGRSAPAPLCHRAPGSEAPGGAGPQPPRRSASGL